jgi:radical SAM protein with 4Fe4S-binding SPASM domain
MSEEVLTAVLTGIRNHAPGVEVILPFWNGEPLLYKGFTRFVETLVEETTKGLCLGSISIHTNGNGLTEENSQVILDSGLFSPITLSLDAVRASTYDQIRRGGDLLTVCQNIETFLRLRKNTNSKKPAVILQFIVMDENIQETSLFVAHWQKIFTQLELPLPKVIFSEEELQGETDVLFIRPLIPDSDTSEAREQVKLLHERARQQILFPESALAESPRNPSDIYVESVKEPSSCGNCQCHKREKTDVRGPCPGIFTHLGVTWEGNVSPCCRDFEAVIKLGNVLEESLSEIWTGQLLKDYRLAHIRGEFDKIPLCCECSGQPFGTISHQQIIDYLKSIGEEREINGYLRRMGAI